MTAAASLPAGRLPRGLLWALLANFLWMNASEVFRYLVFVMPMMRSALPELPGVAPMSLPVFAVWGLWDALLILATTGFSWLFVGRYGAGWRQGALAGTLVWLAVFVLLWLALLNMSLATPAVLAAALPLSWLELAVAGLIVAAAARRWPPREVRPTA